MTAELTDAAELAKTARRARGAARRAVATGRLATLSSSSEPNDESWREMTMEERIAAVWELTLQCDAWSRDGDHEPRLQRSVSRVQRSRG